MSVIEAELLMTFFWFACAPDFGADLCGTANAV